MATIVNNPPAAESSSNGMGFILGAIMLIVFVVLFFIYILPFLRGSLNTTQTPQVNVPDKIDVNVDQK